MTDDKWAHSLFTDSPPDYDEDAASLARHLDNEVAEGWELVREDAESALSKNPDDETAQAQILAYRQWKRTQALPSHRRDALVLTSARKLMSKSDRVGRWKRTPKGYVIHITGCEVGDVVRVRRSDGVCQNFTLVKRVAENFYRGRERREG